MGSNVLAFLLHFFSPAKLSDLSKCNVLPTVTKIRSDLQRWMNLSVSLLGRIAIIKMNVLPCLLYPIQMLPTYIPLKLFKLIHSAFRRFVWKNKRPRMKLQNLQFTISKGGLALPNLIYYHWASQLRFVADSVKDSEFSFTDLESIGLDNVSMSDLPFVSSSNLQIKMKDNFIATNIFKSLNSICKHFGLSQY